MHHDDEREIARARDLFRLQRDARWRVGRTDARERIGKLRRLRDAVLAHRPALHRALEADFRKHPAETEITEVLPVLQEIGFAVRHLPRWMRPRRVAPSLVLLGTRSEIRYEPRGVVLVMSPWNYPFGLMVMPLVAAIAAGNCVVLRPSEKTPNTRRVLADMVADAFEPHEVAVVGGGVPTARALLTLPFNHVFFTGSTEVGREVMRAAAEHLASVTLELGGKSPVVVDASADVDAAARQIAWGKLINGGQTCIAPDYVLVHASREAELLEGLRRAVATAYGDSTEAVRAAPELCRMIDDAAWRRLVSALERTVDAGARVVLGGQVDAADRYVAPTVLAGVPRDAPLMREEIFGPVLPVLTYGELDDALATIRRGPEPLALYLFARDRSVVERVLRGTTAGDTVVNDVLLQYGNPRLPFGGVGESGMGSYHGHHGFRAFSHERSVVHGGPIRLLRAAHPPYGRRTWRVLALLDRLFR